MGHAYNLSTKASRGLWITWGQEFETSLANEVKLHVYQKYKKLAGHGGACLWSQLLGRLRQENCLNPGDRGCGEPRSCHCTPAWVTRAKLRLKMVYGKTSGWLWVHLLWLCDQANSVSMSQLPHLQNQGKDLKPAEVQGDRSRDEQTSITHVGVWPRFSMHSK